MTRGCGGGTSGCGCAVQGDDGVDVTGDGSAANPYVIALAGAIATVLNVGDTATVNLTRTGDGSAGNPYVITAAVIDGTVTPATNPTLDIVGAKVTAPLEYAAGPREIGLKISADPGNNLSTGTDDGLHAAAVATIPDLISGDADNQLVQGSDDALFVPPPGGGGAWLLAEITVVPTEGAFSLTGDIPGGPTGVTIIRPASLPPPNVGDQVYVAPPPAGETNYVMVGNDSNPYYWRRAVIADDAPLTIDFNDYIGAATGVLAAVAMPSYTPVVSDVVAVITRGGPNYNYLILGLAPTEA